MEMTKLEILSLLESQGYELTPERWKYLQTQRIIPRSHRRRSYEALYHASLAEFLKAVLDMEKDGKTLPQIRDAFDCAKEFYIPEIDQKFFLEPIRFEAPDGDAFIIVTAVSDALVVIQKYRGDTLFSDLAMDEAVEQGLLDKRIFTHDEYQDVVDRFIKANLKRGVILIDQAELIYFIFAETKPRKTKAQRQQDRKKKRNAKKKR